MKRTYGYCRISRKTQNIERQERNILEAYPEARISKEAYTGTKLQGRKRLDEILKQIKAGIAWYSILFPVWPEMPPRAWLCMKNCIIKAWILFS